jgi:hypothetical protein
MLKSFLRAQKGGIKMSRIFHISGQLKKDGDLVLKDCDFDAFLVMREDKTAYGYIAKVFQDGELEKSGKESIAGIIMLDDKTKKPRIAFCENVAKTKHGAMSYILNNIKSGIGNWNTINESGRKIPRGQISFKVQEIQSPALSKKHIEEAYNYLYTRAKHAC